MSAELEADWKTGATVYFLLRNATGSIWNGSSFASYLTANYATYPITGAEQATSGYFTGAFPSVAAGVYNAVAKLQAGGSPAETDTTIATGTVDWGGSAVSGTQIALTTAQSESYAAKGSTASIVQMLYIVMAWLTNLTISGTTYTALKLDGSTTAGTGTLDSATAPTTNKRAT